jgi:hypothetical protein
MTAIPLPSDPFHILPKAWRAGVIRRDHQASIPRSQSGEVVHGRLNTILRKKLLTVSNPPEDARLDRELDDILQECSLPNWDGYEAKPIGRDSVTVKEAIRFLKQLPDHISYPELCPEPTGELGMMWEKGGYRLAVSIDSSRTISYGGISLHGRLYGEVRFTDGIPSEILELLERIDG